MKRTFVFIWLCLSWAGIRAQTVFTYGKKAVSKDEFLKAYHKNNASSGDSTQNIRSYLDLYVKFKLKVQAALDRRMDTLPSQKADLLNFRRSIQANFMKEDKYVKALAEEAFDRSQKDIHVAHIFVPFDENIVKNPGAYQTVPRKKDTVLPYKKIQEAYSKLSNGQDFNAVSAAYTLEPSDPSVPRIVGDLGYITVFSLPYELENIVYSLPVGGYSKPYHSKAGYHIFKNIEERPAVGKVSISQILLAYPPNSSAADKEFIKKQGDSIYNALVKGASFEELVKKYSDDRTSTQSNGVLPSFGVGRYDAKFENVAFSLTKKGEYAKPFESAYGIHILKLNDRVNVPKDKASSLDSYQAMIREDGRMEMAKENMQKDILKKVAYKPVSYDQKTLWAVTDSFLSTNKIKKTAAINQNTTLFSFAKSDVKVNEWLRYVKATKTLASPPYPEMMNKFVGVSALEYYQDHMEDYNPEFKYQIAEFKEGNLLFEIMEKEVWGKAAADSVGLMKFYESHKNQYKWGPSATAVFFTATDPRTAEEARKQLSVEGLSNWHNLVDNSGGRILADSGRFDLTQIPITKGATANAGMMTPNLINDQDSTVTFTYIQKVYNDPAPRNFEDARGLVVNDYQALLEDKWIAELKKKYPVVVNEAVVKSLTVVR